MTALARLVRSTPFRLALGYAAVFALAGAAIFATFAWRANQLLTTSVVETLGADDVCTTEEATFRAAESAYGTCLRAR